MSGDVSAKYFGRFGGLGGLGGFGGSPYPTLVGYSFRRYSTYRVATAAGAFTNLVFGVLRAYVLIALWQARPTIGGYDVTDAVTYCFFSQAMIAVVSVFGWPLELSERVRTGDVAIDLHRPSDLQAWWLADDLGRALFQLLGRAVPIFVVGAFLFTVHVPHSPVRGVLTLVSVGLAVLVGFALRYLVSLAAFWLLDDRGIRAAAGLVAMFFSGLVLPLVLFPGWFGAVVRVLPWSALLQIPADVFLGKYPGWQVAGALGLQAGWAAALLLAGRAATGAARRRVVVQGG